MVSTRLGGVTLFGIMAALVAGKPSCHMGTSRQLDAYPPDLTKHLRTGEPKSVPWFTVDLDAPAKTRWAHVVQPQKEGIRRLTDVVVDTLSTLLGNSSVQNSLKKINSKLDAYSAALPNDYGEEIQGIAAATDMDPAIIFVYNMFYSVFGACTSIVAEGRDGAMLAARNLDFGLWPSFNITAGNIWGLTEALRPLVINVDVQRNGTTVYKATTFNGFIGVHTAVRPGVLSTTIDSRFDSRLDTGLLRWLLLPKLDSSAVEVTMAVRAMIEASESYDSGFARMNATRVLGPAYIIMGGSASGQGAVLTKGAKETFHGYEGETIAVVDLKEQASKGHPFLVQTNYDGDADGSKKPPFFDDRRDPAKLCMAQLGESGTNFTGLYNLLSSTPNLNRLTAYTTLMDIQKGELQAYRQLCDSLHCPLY